MAQKYNDKRESTEISTITCDNCTLNCFINHNSGDRSSDQETIVSKIRDSMCGNTADLLVRTLSLPFQQELRLRSGSLSLWSWIAGDLYDFWGLFIRNGLYPFR